MIRTLGLLFGLGLWGAAATAQDDRPDPEALNAPLVEYALVEAVAPETGPASLVVDMTRTKTGRDFYEAFYQEWNTVSLAATAPMAAPATDSSRTARQSAVFNPGDYVITIEDLPVPGNSFTSIILVRVEDEVLFQQFVQARRELVEELADYAVSIMEAYFAELQSVQMQLGPDGPDGGGPP